MTLRPRKSYRGGLSRRLLELRATVGGPSRGRFLRIACLDGFTNRNYDQAVSWDLPADVKSLVQKNLGDERRHLAYIENAIENRLWEKQATRVR